MKTLELRRAGHCRCCGTPLPAGTRAVWDAESRTVRCVTCPTQSTPPSVESSPVESAAVAEAADEVVRGAGASARREYERRHDAREQRVRDRHPKIGGLLLALVGDPTTTNVWAQGADGEGIVADRLSRLENAVVLNDRRMRRPDGTLSHANIDHIAVTPTGVWVVDAKTHRGKLEVRRSGGPFSPRTEQLYINGRNQTRLVDGINRQVDAVRSGLAAFAPDVEVRGALCFVGTELPWMDEDIAGTPLRGRRGILTLLRKPGPLTAEQRDRIAARLDAHFPPA